MSDETPDKEQSVLSQEDFMPMSHIEPKSEDKPETEEVSAEPEPEKEASPPKGYVPVQAVREAREKYRELQSQFDELKKSVEHKAAAQAPSMPDPDEDEIREFLRQNSSDPEVKALQRMLSSMESMREKIQYFDERLSKSDMREAEDWHSGMMKSLKEKHPGIDIWENEDSLNEFYRFAAESNLTSDKAFVTGFEGFFREAITKAEVDRVLKKKSEGRKAALPKTGSTEAPATAFPYDDRVKRALEKLKAAGN